MPEIITIGKEELENLKKRVRRLELEAVEQRQLAEELYREPTNSVKAKNHLERLTDCFLTFSIDPLENINRLTALCGQLLGATCALYNRLEGGLLCSLGCWNTPPDYLPQDQPAGHICYDVICKGRDEFFIVRDLPATSYCVSDPNVTRYNLKTYVGKPVMFAGTAVGSLCAVFQRDFEPDEADRRIMTLIAAAISIEEERRQAIQALRESEERYRKLIVASPDGVTIVGLDGRLSYASPRILKIFGDLDESELIGHSPLEWVAPEDRQAAAANIDSIMTNAHSVPKYYQLLRKNGTRFYGEINSTPLTDSTGRPAGIVSVIRDVTDRWQAEEALKESENKFRILAEQSIVGIAIIQDGLFRYVNPKFAQIHGYQADELVDTLAADTIFPDDISVIEEQRKRQSLNEESRFQCRKMTKGGGILNTEIYAAPVVFNNKQATISVLLDVTGHKRMEDALKESEEKYRTLVETAEDVIIMTDLQGRHLFRNSAYYTSLGYEVGAPLEDDGFARVHPDDRPLLREKMKELIAKGTSEIEYRVRHNEGNWIHRFAKSRTTYDESGQPKAFLSIIRDITERKKADESFARMDKLEAVGTLAAGIAHDFNNLLGGVFGYIELSRRAVKKNDLEAVDRHLEKALSVFNRAKDLTQQFLTFAKGGLPIRKTQSLSANVRKTISFSLSGSNVSPIFSIPEDIWLCDFDENQISQVLDNIVINARQAMPGGGVIEVSANNVACGEIADTLPKRDYIRIAILDHGTGISPEHLPHIFDPFFTTKHKGSGLGLATSHSIIRQHEGFIDVDSEPGRGTTFHIYLPASSKPISLAGKDKSQHHQGKGRILVMDDEEFILDLVAVILKDMGYDVVTASNGNEALAAVSAAVQARQPFIGAILDLTVPGGLGGREILGDMMNIDPHIKAIASSGYSEDPVMANPSEHGFVGRLIKPYRTLDLSAALASLFHPSP